MYYLLLAILYPVSLLPLRVLYLVSDFAFLLLYYYPGYRKELVRKNFEHAFPEKGTAEIENLTRSFYRNFTDQWIETLKLLSISKKGLNKRVQGNWEVFRELDEQGRNTYALLGHTFNWEWANIACQLGAPQQFAGVYLPLSSKPFDRLMQRIRRRGGGWLISMKSLRSGLARVKGVRHIIGMIADQNPSVTEVAEWLPFMNRSAPFFRGPEQMASRAKGAVVFAGIKKIKRGHYKVNLIKITDDASKLPPGTITKQYVLFMEQQLQEQPANWLWSHNRWKHKPPAKIQAKNDN